MHSRNKCMFRKELTPNISEVPCELMPHIKALTSKSIAKTSTGNKVLLDSVTSAADFTTYLQMKSIFLDFRVSI